MYWVLEAEGEGRPHVLLLREEAREDLLWARGSFIDPATAPKVLRLHAQRGHDVYPDFMDVGLALAVSTRFKTTLEAAGVDNAQYFPATLWEDDRLVASDYFVVNVLGRVAAVDLQSTKRTEFRGKIVRLMSLSLDVSQTHSLRMFRLHEYPQIVIVDDGIKDALTSAGLSGVSLRPAEGWSDSHRF